MPASVRPKGKALKIAKRAGIKSVVKNEKNKGR